MGGTYGEIRGTSKIEVYLEYQKDVSERGYIFESFYPDPKYKKSCKAWMVQDAETGEWILNYHWHT